MPGFDSGPLIGEADLIIVLECDVPWYPGSQQPARRLPRRAHRRGPGLRALPDALVPERPLDRRDAFHGARRARCGAAPGLDRQKVDARRARLIERHNARRAKAAEAAQPKAKITAAHFSRAIGEAVGDDAIIFNEYPLTLDHCPREKPGTFYRRRARPAASAGGWAPRSAPSSRRRTS